ncbi:MAG: methionine--tRNA ligase subunit beta [Phycisphaerales bacterium]|jgi:methionyl-tRNA synthetase|nr:methionine--tRNA ligase subunit beta [Phycisphaerales bacterium]
MTEFLKQIAYDDFAKLDLRVVTVTKAELHPDADRLLKLQIDDGTPEGRQICAGMKEWYTPEELEGSQVIIVANLEPRKIRGELSEGMVIAATRRNGEEAEDVAVLRCDREMPSGSKVS